jgi:predicted Zn-dependent protease
LPDLGDNSTGNLSEFDEQRIGEKIIREIKKDPDYSTNWIVYDYLNQLGKTLVNSARSQRISGSDATGPFAPKFDFFAVKDKSINAFALPGGYIGVHTGLMVLAENESELASVLGHEIGHITQKHIARGAGFSKESSVLMLAAMLVAALAVKNNPNAAQGLAVGGQALAIQNQLSYSRSAEREADRIGFQILQASELDVSGMPAFSENAKSHEYF